MYRRQYSLFLEITHRKAGLPITSGLPQFGPDEYIVSFTLLFSFSHRLDSLLIRFDGKRKIRSFNLVRHQADGT